MCKLYIIKLYEYCILQYVIVYLSNSLKQSILIKNSNIYYTVHCTVYAVHKILQ